MPRDTSRDGEQFQFNHPTWLQVGKRSVDIAAALFFICAFGWLYVILGICVMISSGAPVLYSQKRCGRGGRMFNIYKFRSMRSNAAQVLEELLKNDPVARQEWAEYQKLENDPRITRFGHFIRKTSLDELPQFWNVLVGDMSLIGPRPVTSEEKMRYGQKWAHYCAVRPGITGLWQVSGRNQLNYPARVALDAQYVETLSPVRDIEIVFRTFVVLAVGRGAR